MIFRLITISIVGLTLAGCMTTSRFEWGGYENQLYRYYRNADHRDDYKQALERAVANGAEADRVAPGLNAELGFLAFEEGDEATARQYFNEEIRLFPESRAFLESYLANTAQRNMAEPNSEMLQTDSPAEAQEIPTS